MTTILSSCAVFKAKAAEAGVPDNDVARLEGQNITTLGTLAFAVSQPGETPTQDQLRDLLRPPGGNEPNVGRLAAIRRLIFISQTLAVAEVKTMVDGPTDGGKKELPPAERASRITEQKRRLQGLSLVGELECSYASYDLVMEMVEGGAVTYLPPNKFPTRRAEIGQDKTGKEITIDSQSNLKLNDAKRSIQCDTSTELLLSQALTRRALALDLVGVASYNVVQAYNAFLMNHLQVDPPPGYAKVSVQQILRADKQAFLRMAEKTTDGLRRRPDGSLPMDVQFPLLEADPQVTFHLLPLASPSSSAPSPTKRPTDEPAPTWRPFKREKGKGKGKGKIPAELQGKVTVTKTGKPICYAFNLSGGCSSGLKPGATCAKGLHVCAEPRCGRHHSMQDHAAHAS